VSIASALLTWHALRERIADPFGVGHDEHFYGEAALGYRALAFTLDKVSAVVARPLWNI
jgi:hypothetical protein